MPSVCLLLSNAVLNMFAQIFWASGKRIQLACELLCFGTVADLSVPQNLLSTLTHDGWFLFSNVVLFWFSSCRPDALMTKRKQHQQRSFVNLLNRSLLS